MSSNNTTIDTKSKFAFLFPGQGSQAVGMGKELYENSPAAKLVFDEIDDALNQPLSKLIFEGPESELTQTHNTQPGIMAVSLAAYKAMEELLGKKDMPEPTFVAGHSLGEYTALAITESLDISSTAKLVQERGRLMQEACNLQPGTMAAIIGLDEVIIEEISRQTGTYISNINTDQQVVISGNIVAVAQALDMASARGARRAMPLKVSGAFHSALMEPARDGLENAVNSSNLKIPNTPIVANITGQPINTVNQLKKELVSQICECVQWKRSIEYMISLGITSFIEIGPGNALNGMLKRIDKSVEGMSIGNFNSIQGLTLK